MTRSSDDDLSDIIVWENSEFIVINKPAGYAVQRIDDAPSILELLKQRLNLDALYLTHRLDKETSGLLILSKTSAANRAISMQFQAGTVDKYYLALTNKKPKKKQGWIKGDMQKSRRKAWRLSREMNNPAITYFYSIRIREKLWLLILKPYTGKTHQLRVAAKSLGAPILGDSIYNPSEASQEDRLYLHAFHLSFTYAEQKLRLFTSPRQGSLFNDDEIRLRVDESLVTNFSWPDRR